MFVNLTRESRGRGLRGCSTVPAPNPTQISYCGVKILDYKSNLLLYPAVGRLVQAVVVTTLIYDMISNITGLILFLNKIAFQ